MSRLAGAIGWIERRVSVEAVCRDIESLIAVNATSVHQPEIDHYNLVRADIEDIYRHAVEGPINSLSRNIRLQLHRREPTDAGGLVALFLILSDDFESEFAEGMSKAGAEAYRHAEEMMGEKVWGEPAERAKSFAEQRAKDLENAPQEILERLHTSLQIGLTNKETGLQLLRRFNEAVQEAKDIEGSRVEETEATITMGMATDAVLVAAGYTHKRWLSQRDDRVRATHVKCDEQGYIPLGRAFSNGLRYPGDPNGPLEEIINCRCVLVPKKK